MPAPCSPAAEEQPPPQFCVPGFARSWAHAERQSETPQGRRGQKRGRLASGGGGNIL